MRGQSTCSNHNIHSRQSPKAFIMITIIIIITNIINKILIVIIIIIIIIIIYILYNLYVCLPMYVPFVCVCIAMSCIVLFNLGGNKDNVKNIIVTELPCHMSMSSGINDQCPLNPRLCTCYSWANIKVTASYTTIHIKERIMYINLERLSWCKKDESLTVLNISKLKN